jgi:hypothetical protein
MNASWLKGADARSLVLVTVFVAFLAALHLPYPLTEDQAAFTYGAREIAAGAHMYREFWDIKQPGIYWWYTAGGMLFGFDALGVRWMDLCWSICVAAVLWTALRQRGLLAAVLGPCLVFGAFYAKVTQGHLSQIEWLVSGPIAVMLWCVGGADRNAGRRQVFGRYLIAGVMVALVAMLKVMLALLPLSMLAVALALSRWKDGLSLRQLLRDRVLAATLGLLLVVLPLGAWMQWNGTLAGALWTAFVYPAEAVREYEHQTLSRLIWALQWFKRGNIWLLPWALWALYAGLRRGSRLELLCLAWGASSVVVICMQVLSYWEYHFDLLFMPLGILAALGFVDVLDRLRTRKSSAMGWATVGLMAVCVVASMVVPLTRKTAMLSSAMPFTAERQRAFNTELDDRWPLLEASAAAVKDLSKPTDRIIVWGDPRLYFMMDRRPVLEVNGSAIHLTKQLQAIAARIRANPPPLIYMSTQRDHLTNHGGAVLPNTVRELYQPYYEDRLGIWYRRRARPAP